MGGKKSRQKKDNMNKDRQSEKQRQKKENMNKDRQKNGDRERKFEQS